MSELNVETMTLVEFVEHIKGNVRGIGEGFEKPDDDWMPVLLSVSEGGHVPLPGGGIDVPKGVAIVALPVMNDEAKQLYTRTVFPILLVCSYSRMAALVTSAWMTHVPKELADKGYENIVPPSKSPNRIEVLIISAFTPTEEITTNALIYRDGIHPPYLGEFDQTVDVSDGRFKSSIQSSLQVAQKMLEVKNTIKDGGSLGEAIELMDKVLTEHHAQVQRL